MPELPDLEVIRAYLAPRLPRATIVAAAVRRPIIVRNLLGDDFAAHLAGRLRLPSIIVFYVRWA